MSKGSSTTWSAVESVIQDTRSTVPYAAKSYCAIFGLAFGISCGVTFGLH